MEKILNDIYVECEELCSAQIDILIDNLEQLSSSKFIEENSPFEEDPNQTVARENCEALGIL